MINKVGRFFLAKGVKFVWLFHEYLKRYSPYSLKSTLSLSPEKSQYATKPETDSILSEIDWAETTDTASVKQISINSFFIPDIIKLLTMEFVQPYIKKIAPTFFKLGLILVPLERL